MSAFESQSYRIASEPSSFASEESSSLSSRLEGVVAAVTGLAAKIAPALQGGTVSNALFSDLKTVALLLQENYSPVEVRAVLSCPEIAAIRATLPVMVARIETELEKTEAQKQIAILEAEGAIGFEKFVFYNHYKNLVRKEWLLYQQLCTDAELRRMRFVFAGCGAMPMTAIGMADTFGVHVDCYDVDREAYQLAGRMVEKLGMQDKMGIYHGNALDIDYSRYDAVIVANLAQPQMQIIKNIASYKNIKIMIVRRVIGLVSLLYASFDPAILPKIGMELVSTADPNDKRSVHQSVLLKKALPQE